MAEHRVSMLSSRLRRHEDPTRSRDPRVQAVLAELARLEIAPEPRAHFRTELRAQLVAVAPRIIAEGRTEHAATATRRRPLPIPLAERGTSPVPTTAPKHADSGLRDRLTRVHLGRPLGVLAGVAAAVMLILGGAVWMSQKSLPGDSLYGLKRASEGIRLTFAGNDVARAKDFLNLAQTRVDEAHALVSSSRASALGTGPQATGGVTAQTSTLVTSALGSADSDVVAAWKLLATKAATSGSAAPLTAMLTWAPGQLRRLDSLSAALPASALRTRATHSATVVRGAQANARTLTSNINCKCGTQSKTNYLHPTLCSTCSTRTATPGTTSGGGPGRTTGTARPHVPGGVSPRTVPVVTVPVPAGSTPQTVPHPSIPGLPSLPVKLPTAARSLPISVGSCGVSVSLGPIGLPLSTCTAHA